MAIDTAEKRKAMIAFGFAPARPMPTPNVSKDAEWRSEMLTNYSGIPSAPPAPPSLSADDQGLHISIGIGI